MNIEQVILRNLLVDDSFMRKVMPFVKPEYFEGVYSRLFKEVCKFVGKYNRLPTLESFKIELDEATAMPDDIYNQALEILPEIFTAEEIDQEWLVDKTEKWCQDRAVFNAIMEGISIIDGKHQSLTKNALPDLLSDALSVSFDTNIGHDYIEDFSKRYDFYQADEEKMPFDIDMLNTITKGGIPNKSLNVILAGTGVGKSLAMCHFAGSFLEQGKNVLYISMEMAEERVAERIDSNILDVPIAQLETMSKDAFSEKIARVKKNTTGKLIVKEYPTGSAHSGHFRALLNELKLKKKFKPDIIFVDYINICASSRMKAMGGSINSYTYIKAIAEELRGLAMEFHIPVFTATQTTRSGFSNSDIGLEDTSESFGLPATADLMVALISTEELEAQGQVMVKQLKNRYNDVNSNKRFVIGIDRARMRLMDAEGDPTAGLMKEDVPVFDQSKAQEKYSNFTME